MHKLVAWLALIVAIVALVLCIRHQHPGQPDPGQPQADACDRDSWASITACLVPGSDPRADRSRQLGSSDCYWAREPVKTLQQPATGAPVTFGFNVVNRCSAVVTVRLEFEAGTLGFGTAGCGGEGERAQVEFGRVTREAPVTSVCQTLPYGVGTGTRRRTYTLRATSIDGKDVNVELDPEVVLERAEN
jgi:hypothetical protein